MKTTLAGRFVALTILIAFLNPLLATAQILVPAGGTRQEVEWVSAKALPGASSCHAQPSLAFYASLGNARAAVGVGGCDGDLLNPGVGAAYEGFVRSHTVSGSLVMSGLTSHGIPDWLYCFLHKRWCQS
jgi:hypothetical protein